MNTRPIDVMIAGTQKGGTSTLHQVLASHSSVGSHAQQEFGFFVSDELFSRGYEREAQRCFDRDAAAAEVLLAKSVGVMFMPVACERLRQHNPKCKVIVSLRNPFDRAISAYRYQVQVGREDGDISFQNALERERNPEAALDPDLIHVAYIQRGLYVNQLQMLWQAFGRESVLVVRFESLRNQPETVYQEIQNFCGLRHEPLEVGRVENQTGDLVSPTVSRLARTPLARVLTSAIPPGLRESAYQRLKGISGRIERSVVPEVSSASFPDWAVERIVSDLRELENLTGLDLHEWESPSR